MEYKPFTLELPERFNPKKSCTFKLHWRDREYCIYARHLRYEPFPHDFYIMKIETVEWLDGSIAETINIKTGYKVAQTFKQAVQKLAALRGLVLKQKQLSLN